MQKYRDEWEDAQVCDASYNSAGGVPAFGYFAAGKKKLRHAR